MIIQINEYDPAAFQFAKAYLKAEYEQWGYTPLHRLVSDEFYKELNNGTLDSNSYDIEDNSSRFDGEECLLLLRYYEKHKNYDRDTTIRRLHSELGAAGSIFKKKNRKSGGRTIRKSRHIGRTRRRRT
jgi:hypothetical protein